MLLRRSESSERVTKLVRELLSVSGDNGAGQFRDAAHKRRESANERRLQTPELEIQNQLALVFRVDSLGQSAAVRRQVRHTARQSTHQRVQIYANR